MMLITILAQTAADSLNAIKAANDIQEIKALLTEALKVKQDIAQGKNLIPGVSDIITTFAATGLGAAVIRFVEKKVQQIIDKLDAKK